MQDSVDRFKVLKERAERNRSRKIRADEKFTAAKGRVEEVVAEIKAAGYPNPKELGAIKAEKEAELEKNLASLETVLEAQEAILDKVEV